MSLVRRTTSGFYGATTGFTAGAATGIPHLAGIGAVVGFVGGLFGGGSSGGSASKNSKKIKRALKIQNKILYSSLKRDAALAIQANERAARLYNDLRDQKYEDDLKNYELAVDQRAENYQLARDAYEDSVRAFDETVDLNDISASMAINDARRVFNDRQQDLNNRSQILRMQLKAGERDRNLNKQLITSQMNASIKDAQLNAQGINTNLRIALQNGQDAIAESTRAFEYATQLAANQIAIKDIQLGVDRQQIKSEIASLEGEKTALISSAQLKEQDVLNSLDNSIAEADFAKQTIQLAQDERYADSAIQTDQLRRQGLLEQGAQLAKGQAGRSAAKSVQGLAFANQQAQALLASAIVRADAKYTIDKNKIAQSILFARQQGKSELTSTAIGLNKAGSEFAAAQLRMGARRLEMGVRDVEAQMAVDDIAYKKAQTNFQNRRISRDFNAAKSMASIDLSKMSNQLLSSQAQFRNQLINNEFRLYDLQQQTKLSFNSIAYASQSAKDELKLSKERIDFDKMLANRAAASQVLDQPKVPKELPPPIKAPELVQQPLPEINWKQIKKAMAKSKKAKMPYNPSGMSEFNSLITNIQGIGEQAAAIANSYQAPPPWQLQQQAQPININTDSSAGLYQPSENISINTTPVDYTTPDLASTRPKYVTVDDLPS